LSRGIGYSADAESDECLLQIQTHRFLIQDFRENKMRAMGVAGLRPSLCPRSCSMNREAIRSG
jgi:hypothetical protein